MSNYFQWLILSLILLAITAYPYTNIRNYGSDQDTIVIKDNYDGTRTIAPAYPYTTSKYYSRIDEWRTIEREE